MWASAAAVRVEEEVFDGFLDGGGEEVALDCRDTAGGLGGNYVDSYDAAAGGGSVDCYLGCVSGFV